MNSLVEKHLFFLIIEDTFWIDNLGIVVTGKLHGKIYEGDPCMINDSKKNWFFSSTVGALEYKRVLYKQLSTGDNDESFDVGILLKIPDVLKGESLIGCTISGPTAFLL